MAPKETVRTAKNEFELSMNSSLVVRAFWWRWMVCSHTRLRSINYFIWDCWLKWRQCSKLVDLYKLSYVGCCGIDADGPVTTVHNTLWQAAPLMLRLSKSLTGVTWNRSKRSFRAHIFSNYRKEFLPACSNRSQQCM
jgi:hypothetical protein